MEEELTGGESQCQNRAPPSKFPVVGALPQAEKFGDSRKGITRGNDLMAGSNVTIRVTGHGLLTMSASASAIPKVNIWFRVIGWCEHTGEQCGASSASTKKSLFGRISVNDEGGNAISRKWQAGGH